MQRKFQHIFTKSKMNKDLDARLVEPDEYRDGQNISVSRSESSDVGALENILGNELFNQLTSNNVTSVNYYLLQFIGWYIDEDTDKIYIFATDFQDSSSDQISLFASPNSSHKIILADLSANTISTIVSGRFLNFSYNSPILDSSMIESQLFWTDNRNQPRCINVETAESNPNYYFNEDHISLVKYYPYKPIQLFEEYSSLAGLITTSALRTEGFTTFDSIYPYFLFDKASISTSMLAAIKDNIGMQAYAKGNANNIWDFKIAYVQEITGMPNDPFTSGIAIAVFIDRDLSSRFTVEADPDGMTLGYTVNFIDQTSKDVSSPWLREDQVKLKINAISSTAITYTSGASGNYDYAQSLYKFGTRSPYNYLEDTTGGGAWSPFEIENYFPKNTGDAAKGFPRVTHPSLDPNKYYCITNVGNPGDAAKQFTIKELTSFVGGSLSTVNNSSLLNTDDVVTIHWPNKYYNYNFPGDQRFLQDKFVRFAYRFRYDDGQYSVISPFTQEVFIPKQKGYFLKNINRQKSSGAEDNNYVPQENTAGQTTIVDFMENEVTEVKLRIPCEYAINTLSNNLKVSEIDILYKDSMGLSIKVAETIDVDDTSVTSNSTKLLEYTYQSKQPIKTLRSSETTRVYDNAPTRAKTLSSAGNRVILGNYFDRHTSPNSLAYYVSAGRKLTPGGTSQNPLNNISPNLPGKFSTVSYPNHSLKQGRTYQVGLILQDRYGRSSDVILSSFTDTNFTLQSGSFASNPQTFYGSTLYHPYLSSVTSPLSTSSINSNVTNSGIVNWPGDSLKILFTEQIPRTINYASGYPGLYEDPLATAAITDSSTSNKYIEIATGGNRNSIQPNDTIKWTASGVDYEAVVQWAIAPYPGNTENRYGITTQDGQDPPVYPAVGQSVDFITAGSPLGWYSYKVVVKQLEQDYYNVYLPSLLNGTPVIKPFNLTCSFGIGSKVVTVDAIGTIEYLTFPLLEGMKVVTPGGKTYYINNILNHTQFELTSAVTANEASVSAVFSTETSSGVLNVTTLLTDNANKVPPALNETSPVQVNYSTSDIKLIPKVALLNNFSSDIPYFAFKSVAAGPVFPGLQELKVQSIGNYESLFNRGSYNGLYNADTDPPTAIIQNTFNLGADSQTAKPSSEAEFLPAIFETTPTKSAIEIFYETSTSGSVKELNTLVRDNLTVPTQLVLYPGTGTGTSPLGTVSFNESLQYSAAATIVKFQIVDQNGNIVSYANAESLNLGTASYQNGTAISTAPFTVTESAVASEQANSVYLLKPTATNPIYSSSDSSLNSVSFNVNFNFLQFSILPIAYSIALNTLVQNSAPVFKTSRVNAAGTVYYVPQGLGTGAPVSPGPTNWGNADGTNSTLSRATNGSNASNNSNSSQISWSLFVKNQSMFGQSGFVLASSIEGLALSIISEGDQCTLSVGKYNLEYVTGNINVEIRATDQNGNGLTTVISQFDLRLLE